MRSLCNLNDFSAKPTVFFFFDGNCCALALDRYRCDCLTYVRIVEERTNAVEATLSVTTLTDNDLLEVVIDGTIGTGTLPTGVFGDLRVKEKAAAAT